MLAMCGVTYGFIKAIETCAAITFLESASQESYQAKHYKVFNTVDSKALAELIGKLQTSNVMH